MITPPRQVALNLKDFPDEPWARALVEAVNQFAIQTVQAISSIPAPFYRDVQFTSDGSAVAAPFDIPVSATPTDVHVAQVLSGGDGRPVAVNWSVLSGGKKIRLTSFSGLIASTAYVVRLSMV